MRIIKDFKDKEQMQEVLDKIDEYESCTWANGSKPSKRNEFYIASDVYLCISDIEILSIGSRFHDYNEAHWGNDTIISADDYLHPVKVGDKVEIQDDSEYSGVRGEVKEYDKISNTYNIICNINTPDRYDLWRHQDYLQVLKEKSITRENKNLRVGELVKVILPDNNQDIVYRIVHRFGPASKNDGYKIIGNDGKINNQIITVGWDDIESIQSKLKYNIGDYITVSFFSNITRGKGYKIIDIVKKGDHYSYKIYNDIGQTTTVTESEASKYYSNKSEEDQTQYIRDNVYKTLGTSIVEQTNNIKDHYIKINNKEDELKAIQYFKDKGYKLFKHQSTEDIEYLDEVCIYINNYGQIDYTYYIEDDLQDGIDITYLIFNNNKQMDNIETELNKIADTEYFENKGHIRDIEAVNTNLTYVLNTLNETNESVKGMYYKIGKLKGELNKAYAIKDSKTIDKVLNRIKASKGYIAKYIDRTISSFSKGKSVEEFDPELFFNNK